MCNFRCIFCSSQNRTQLTLRPKVRRNSTESQENVPISKRRNSTETQENDPKRKRLKKVMQKKKLLNKNH